jgi:hypothetical protein
MTVRDGINTFFGLNKLEKMKLGGKLRLFGLVNGCE